jgi:hypothetical protein
MHLLPTTTPYQTFSSGAMPSAASVSDDIVTRLMSALDPIFLANRQSTADRFDQLELSVKTLSEEVKTVRSEARRQARELASCLEGLHKDAVQALTDRTDSSGSEGLSNIEFALGEMLELARDPKAVCEFRF